MSQPIYQPADYSVPCPRCAAAVALPRNAGWRQRQTCAGCGYLVTATWTDGAIVLAAYPSALPRRDEVPRQSPAGAVGRRDVRPSAPVPGRLDPPVYPQTRMEPVYPPPASAPEHAPLPGPGPAPQAPYADVPRPRRGPRQDDRPWQDDRPRPEDGPDWEGARRRVSRAMNGLR